MTAMSLVLCDGSGLIEVYISGERELFACWGCSQCRPSK